MTTIILLFYNINYKRV